MISNTNTTTIAKNGVVLPPRSTGCSQAEEEKVNFLYRKDFFSRSNDLKFLLSWVVKSNFLTWIRMRMRKTTIAVGSVCIFQMPPVNCVLQLQLVWFTSGSITHPPGLPPCLSQHPSPPPILFLYTILFVIRRHQRRTDHYILTAHLTFLFFYLFIYRGLCSTMEARKFCSVCRRHEDHT